MSDKIVLTAKGKKRDDFTKEVLQTLEQGVKDVYTSEKWKNYLDFSRNFHSYSPNNILLIMMQNPTATRVASMKTWNKLGRHVIKGQGANGIKILAPKMHSVEQEARDKDGNLIIDENGEPKVEKVQRLKGFLPVSVYDVSQTEGKALPTLDRELQGSISNKDIIIEALQEIVSPVPIEYEDITNGAKGYFSKLGKIAIKTDMSDVQTVKTAVHEVAHCLLHGENAPQAKADRDTKEIQAESVAYTVCRELGIDTSDYSFSYVASWASDRELSVLKENIEVITSTANNIVNDIRETLADKNINFSKGIVKQQAQQQADKEVEQETEFDI